MVNFVFFFLLNAFIFYLWPFMSSVCVYMEDKNSSTEDTPELD